MAAPVVSTPPASQHEAAVRTTAALEAGVGPFRRIHLAAATSAVTNRFVTSTDMKVGAYTVANSGAMPTEGARKVTVTHTAVGDPDTLGTITVTGTDLAGEVISEDITPISGNTATGTLWFRTITSVEGADWEIDAGEDNDTIVVGCAAGVIAYEGDCSIHSVVVSTAAAGAITISDEDGTIAILKASVSEGTYTYDAACSGYLGVAAAAATDITVLYAA